MYLGDFHGHRMEGNQYRTADVVLHTTVSLYQGLAMLPSHYTRILFTQITHTRSDILQVYTVTFAAMAYSSCTTSSLFGCVSEALLQQKPPIPLCQSQTYILLGFNHQQLLWVSHHRYTKEPPLTPLFHG